MKSPSRQLESSKGHILGNECGHLFMFARGCQEHSHRSDHTCLQHLRAATCFQTPSSHLMPPCGLAKLTQCQERNLGLSPGLFGSKAPVAPSMRWGGRNRPGQTFPGSLSAVPETRSALGNQRGEDTLLLPREEAILSHQRSRGATGSETLRGLPRAEGRHRAWEQSMTQIRGPWARCRGRRQGWEMGR